VILTAREQCNINCVTYQRKREREPSRISAKKLCRLFTKNRKLRKVVRNEIKRNIPTSSHIHRYTQAFSHERQRIISNNCFGQFIKTKLNCKTRVLTKFKKDTFASRNHFYKKKLNLSETQISLYKDLNHRVNYCKLNLNGDIEVNPGPAFIDPAKTIHALYSQGNVHVFGQNAGRQCVPMSLCPLIYVNRNHSIVDISDLVNIMHTGNELYTALSRLSRQTYLLLTELPTMVTVQDTDYSLEFSESYTGNVNLNMNENIPFVMPLDSALEQLQQETFNSFLLAIEYNTVSIFTVSIFIASNGLLKIFDSHARDSFGMPHPHGTCVILEFDSIRNLTEYFKSLYRPDAIYELKGVKIANVVPNEQFQNVNANEIVSDTCTENSDTNLHCCTSRVVDGTLNENTIFYMQGCSLLIYSICFSTIMTCNYWTDKTCAIVEHAIGMYDEALNGHQLSVDHFPESVLICGSQIDIVYSPRHERTLCCTSVTSKVALEKLILANTMQNNGFLIWYFNYSLGCIIHNYVRGKKERTKYFLLASTETDDLHLFKALPDAHSVNRPH
jgi:hypothetical protein